MTGGVSGTSVGGETIPLVSGSGKSVAKVRSILNAAGGVAIGAGIFTIGALVSTLFTGRKSDLVVLGAVSILLAGGGIAFGYSNWRAWGRDFYLRVDGVGLEISYVGFNRPMFVPKHMVRVVAMDETAGTQRFPITPEKGDPTASTDKKPGDAGWAAPPPASRARLMEHIPEHDYLYSPTNPCGDSGLAFLNLSPEDLPNLAIVFNKSLQTPKSAFGVDLPGYRSFGGGRRVPGLMMQIADPGGARAAFGSWKVLRQISPQDVLGEGLFRPSRFSPRIRGALVATGILIFWLVRIVFDLDDFGLM